MKHIKGMLAVSVLYLLALMPLPLARKIGEMLGKRALKKAGRQLKVTKKNIEYCFKALSDKEKSELVETSLIETGRLAGEMGMAWIWSPERVLGKIEKIHNQAVLDDALAEGNGVILLAPHLGNWEVLGLFLSTQYKITSMYRPPKIEMMDRLIRKKRARLGSKLAPANVKGVRMAMKALRAGEVLGILPDQEADQGSGVFAPFFGKDAYSMKLLPQLAAQTGAAVVSGYAKRLPDGQGFELVFSRADEQINSKDLAASAAAMNAEVERCVREVPEQYQWEYKRFDHLRDGKRGYD
ncbi:lysophospholipid acyltransferase family protein [Amphritea balenae]|uniref:Lauroyl acyltransferase n=1 Tax=Amphritea balenae TaxID=452629 RepID=A0A3P1SNX2_9GAMM|nr:lysophospholipid acyltransferase family protein [Amphritea balenae]RRC98856.1 lauroyl acyltransferase [Amphritea balenae]GGK62337.1 lipid A biosynthesis lauroyl acyltransferase [Amphritea balenae]